MATILSSFRRDRAEGKQPVRTTIFPGRKRWGRLGALLIILCTTDPAHAATITVNSTIQVVNPGPSGNSDGLCQLSEAIRAANTDLAVDGCVAGSGADVIVIPAGTYTLSAVDDPQLGGNGLPAITSAITLQGASASTTIIERSTAVGTPDFRLLLITQGSNSGSVILNDLTFRNGRSTTLFQSPGGAIRQGSSTGGNNLDVNRCVFDNNTVFDLLDSNSSGGAISGSFSIPLVVTDSTFTNNSASSGGGAIDGFTSVSNSTFINNSASAGNINGSGGALRGASVTVSNSTFLNNSVNGTTSFGGGAIIIINLSGGTATITRNVFSGNSQNSTNAAGGAIRVLGGGTPPLVTITENLFLNNTSASSAGALFAGSANVVISGNTFQGNHSAAGGGAIVASGQIMITNSTFSGNSAGATLVGGAINSGGGITYSNITVTGNSVPGNGGRGGGIVFNLNDVIRNSIIAGNSAGAATDCFFFSGTVVTSQGHNVIGVDCGLTPGTGDQFGTAGAPINPLLAALADNAPTVMAGSNVGGQTPVAIQTHALLAGSPALNMGDLGPADGISPHCEAADQRGITRPKPSGGICDVGAFEDLTGLGISVTADFSITKMGSPGSVTAGQNVSFTITVTNNGPDMAAATLSDVLPASFTFVSLASPGGWSCTTPSVGATGTVSCTNAGLASGASDVLTLVITANAGGSIGNTATVSTPANDPVSGNNAATAMTNVTGGAANADVAVTKSGAPDPINLGAGNITYSLAVSNNGPSSASNVVLTDTLPAGVTFVSATPGGPICTQAGGTITCNIGTLVSGGMMAVSIVVTPTAAGMLTNTATVTATETDPTPANNTATATTTVSPSADLSVTKMGSPNPVTAGSNLTYTITVNNAGPSAAASVAINDTLPAGTTFVSLASPAGWTCTTPAAGASGMVNCTIASLASGGAASTFTLVVATAAAGNLSNTATVATTTNDPSNANNSATVATTVGPGAGTDFTISAPSTVDVRAGAMGTVTITLTAVGGTFNTPTMLTGTSTLLGPFNFSPNPATIGATSANVTMTFTASRQGQGSSGPGPSLPYPWLPVLISAILFSSVALLLSQRRHHCAVLALGLVLLVAGSQSACIGGSRQIQGPVPVTVTATAGSLSHSVTITVNVTK